MRNNKPYTTETFREKLKELGRDDIEVIGEYVNAHTKIKIKCTNPNCLYEYETIPNSIISRKAGCPVCSKRKIIEGKNDLLTMKPDLKNIIKPGQDIQNIGVGSRKKIQVICPECGNESDIYVYNLSVRGYNCPICGEHWSTPNRFLRSVLSFLLKEKRIKDFKLEYEDNNIKKYRYDGFVLTNNGKKLLIEMQGAQHNAKNKRKKIWVDTIKQVKKDEEKKKEAIKNGYELLAIDCYESSFKYISDNFLRESSPYFYIKEEELEKCWAEIHSSLTKKICDRFNNCQKIVDIAKELNISTDVVTRRLKIGEKLNWCKYSERKRGKGKKVPVVIINEFGEELYVAESFSQAARWLKEKTEENFAVSNIRSVCNGHYKQYKGYKFKYAQKDV